MAERIRIEHEIDCTQEAFWRLFLDESYNHALFRDYLKFPRWEVVHSDVQGEVLHRTVEVEPFVGDLPGAIKKVVGENISYKEIGELDRTKNSYSLKVVPARLADKLKVSGVQSTEPVDGGMSCKRIFVATVEVKIFGVGGLIEKRVLSDLQRSYDLSAKFTNRYIHEHNLSGR
jgi:hypothetical protein